jgi:hypothetical protein
MNLNPKPGRGGSPDPHSKKMKYDEGYHFIESSEKILFAL